MLEQSKRGKGKKYCIQPPTFSNKSWRPSKKHFCSSFLKTFELHAWKLHERPKKNLFYSASNFQCKKLELEQKQLPRPLLELLRIELLELPSMEPGSMKRGQGQKNCIWPLWSFWKWSLRVPREANWKYFCSPYKWSKNNCIWPSTFGAKSWRLSEFFCFNFPCFVRWEKF
jgi:hypothetical protein